MAQGLSGSSGAPVEPTADRGGAAAAGDDDDVTPVATNTPRANPTQAAGESATYTSPNFGYSLTYDPSVWEAEETTETSDSGPLDHLDLDAGDSIAFLVGESGIPGFDALTVCDVRLDQYQNSPTRSEFVITEEMNGDELHASFVLEYTLTTQSGDPLLLTSWVDCFSAPDGSVLLSFNFTTQQFLADDRAATQEELLAGLTFPGQ